jgi:hypothetical protein
LFLLAQDRFLLPAAFNGRQLLVENLFLVNCH